MGVEFSKIIDIRKHPKSLRTLGKAFFSLDSLARKVNPVETPPLTVVDGSKIVEFPSPSKETERPKDDSILDFSDIGGLDGFSFVDDSVNNVLDQRTVEESEGSSESLVAKALKFKEEQSIIYSAIMGRVYESASSGAEGGCGPCGGDGGTSASGGKGSSEGKGSGHEHCKCGAEITSSGYCENGHKV